MLDPFTSQIMYIGSTVNLDGRITQHYSQAKSNVSPKDWFILSLLEQAKQPKWIIIKSFRYNARALKHETALIRKHKPPFNITGNPAYKRRRKWEQLTEEQLLYRLSLPTQSPMLKNLTKQDADVQRKYKQMKLL